MLRSLVSSVAPLFSNLSGGSRTGSQGKNALMAEETIPVDNTMKVYRPTLLFISTKSFFDISIP